MGIGRRVALAALVLIALLAGCASPNPNFYTISAIPGRTVNRSPKVVLVREIGLARYLDRQQIVRSSQDYRLDVLANDWWGEPVGAMLSRVLVEELSQRLPASTVYAESGALSVTPDVSVELNVQRMDADANGTVILAAQAALVFADRRPPVTRSFRFAVPPPTTGLTGEVIAISAAVGQLADGLSVTLAP